MPDEQRIRLEVDAELNDPKYAGMPHHEIKTYNKGCRGPLCRKKSRDYGRERYRELNGVPEQELHKPTVRTRFDPLLERILEEHGGASRVPVDSMSASHP